MLKWDEDKHCYKEYSIPRNWNTPLYSSDMNEIVNCANCGKEIMYGDSYTSMTIHNETGFGYPVCEECYGKEIDKRFKKAKKD